MFSEKGEYSKLYDYLKAKKVKITSGGTAGGKINWDDRAEDKGNTSTLLQYSKIFHAWNSAKCINHVQLTSNWLPWYTTKINVF